MLYNKTEWTHHHIRVTHCNVSELHNKYPHKEQLVVFAEIEPEVKEVQLFVSFSS
jgi:hypothetical protein